ncbi:MAG TPA: class I SAM-dependent methyltransferase [Candidatus Bathyarchaeia archaeon]|nr:class I SAM-dependent methyltransferase [Candidatus Bathyarchaeia archaeon]
MPTSPEMAARDWDRVARDYFGEVVSPLRAGVPAPLARALARVPDAQRKTVGDLGCGIGSLLPTLARRFRRVIGIDFSPAMLSRARAACRAPNVVLHRADLSDLGRFRAKLDVAVTVNAVLTPDPERLDRILAGIQAALRPGGILLGIFPAMEPVLYQGFLIHERERMRHPPALARSRTAAILERSRYDFVHGTYADDDGAQKFFYAFELGHRLRGAGFRKIRIGRVYYSWDDIGGYERFPGEPRMWDWFVRAEACPAARARRKP